MRPAHLCFRLVLADSARSTVDRAALASMQPYALLISTARGDLVERDALLDALRKQRLGGAGLEARQTKPLAADDALPTLTNVQASPHPGYVTEDNLHAHYYQNAVSAIEAWRAGTHVHLLATPLSQPPFFSRITTCRNHSLRSSNSRSRSLNSTLPC